MRCTRFRIALLALILASPSLAAHTLTPHRAQYKVRISVISGQLNTELRKTKEGYVANHVISPTGMSRLFTRGTMDVTSEFISATGGVRPVRFQAVDTIRDDPDQDLYFDWTTNKVSGTVGGDEISLQLDGIAYDSVSIQYELMHDLLSGDLSDQYDLFDINKMRIAMVSNAGRKEVKTKAGKFMAVGIRHQKEGSSRTTTMWCVEELDYLPVVIEQHRKGKVTFRASLVSYTPIRE